MDRGLTNVDLVIHGGGTLMFPDTVDDDGNVLPFGVAALKAFKAKRQLVLHADSPVDGEATMIIPYHSVMEYEVRKIIEDVPKVEDDFCDENGAKIWVIKFYDETGDTLLATYHVRNGETPVYTGEMPTCETSAGKSDGWRDSLDSEVKLVELPPATANASYYAWCGK